MAFLRAILVLLLAGLVLGFGLCGGWGVLIGADTLLRHGGGGGGGENLGNLSTLFLGLGLLGLAIAAFAVWLIRLLLRKSS